MQTCDAAICLSLASLVRSLNPFAVLSGRSLDLAAELFSGRHLQLSRVLRSCAYAGTAGLKEPTGDQYEAFDPECKIAFGYIQAAFCL